MPHFSLLIDNLVLSDRVGFEKFLPFFHELGINAIKAEGKSEKK